MGALFAFLVAAMPDPSGKHYYFEIVIPGSIVGLIVGYSTQRYGRRPAGPPPSVRVAELVCPQASRAFSLDSARIPVVFKRRPKRPGWSLDEAAGGVTTLVTRWREHRMPSESRGTPVAVSGAPSAVGRYRWVICGLLFFCTTINYIDRNSLSVLKTTLQRRWAGPTWTTAGSRLRSRPPTRRSLDHRDASSTGSA